MAGKSYFRWMPITIPKPPFPILTKRILPAWVLVAVIATQIILVNINNSEETSCELLFQRPHYSASLQEKSKRDAIKLNISSNCTQSQLHTDLIATISSVSGGTARILYMSNLVRQEASKEDLRKAHFLEFWVPCKRGSIVNYLGAATGEVFLRSGKVIPISGSIDKSLAVLCQPRAK